MPKRWSRPRSANGTLLCAKRKLPSGDALKAIAGRDKLAISIKDFETRLVDASLENASAAEIEDRLMKVETEQQSIASDLRVFHTYSTDRVITRLLGEQAAAADRVRSAEVRLRRARTAEIGAQNHRFGRRGIVSCVLAKTTIDRRREAESALHEHKLLFVTGA
jgi:hypothetical protein